MTNIQQTISFIKKAHAGQTYGSHPYWTHPVAVAEKATELFGHDDSVYIVALLHDVIEDTPYTAKDLLDMGYSPKIVAAVELLSKDKSLSYEGNIEKIAKSGNILAKKVKYADNFINFNGDKSHWDPKKAEKSNSKYAASMKTLEPHLKFVN